MNLDSKITTALAHSTITTEAKAVLNIITFHRGKTQAVQAKEIIETAALILGVELNERTVKKAVKEIIEQYHIPVCGSTVQPYGYYIVTTAEEKQYARQRLQAQVDSMVQRIAVLDSLQVEGVAA